MKLQIEVNPEDSPNFVGEFLRKKFFAKDYGCYSCFELADGVEPLDKIPVPEWDFDDDNQPILREDDYCEYKFTRARLDGITMLYYWDGDGFLSFILPDGGYLYNSDCKKDYTWNFAKSFDEYWK